MKNGKFQQIYNLKVSSFPIPSGYNSSDQENNNNKVSISNNSQSIEIQDQESKK